MDGQTFEAFIQSERERLGKEREDIFTSQQELEQRLEAVNKELAAITAYEAVKLGKPLPPAEPSPESQPRRRRGQREGGERNTGMRQQVLELIRSRAEGYARGDLLGLTNASGSKSAEQSVSNALAALKKEGLIAQDAKRGPYTAAVEEAA